MPRKRKTTACPAGDCGATSPRIVEIDVNRFPIPQEAKGRIKENGIVFRCSYCGFVWAETHSGLLSPQVTPLGFYDSFRKPNEFKLVPTNYDTR